MAISTLPSPFSNQTFARHISQGFSSDHPGIDVAGTLDANGNSSINWQAIACSGAGKVIEVGGDYDDRGYWIAVQLDKETPSQVETVVIRYLHLAQASGWSVNDRVSLGTGLGYVGNTGKSEKPHLHLDMTLNGTIPWSGNSACVNPALYFGGF